MSEEIEDTIEKVRAEILDKHDWESSYKGYAEELLDNEKVGLIKAANELFRVKPPLTKNLTISRIKASKKTVKYSLRYQGQEVGEVKVEGDEVYLSSKGYEEKNKENFNNEVVVHDVEWMSDEAKNFRRSFIIKKPKRNDGAKGNKEHYLESDLIGEFSKTSGGNKGLTGIQPVKFAGTRFAMKTPISASKLPFKYSGAHGGGIDILARSGHGLATYLTVIEVKDEYSPKEPPKVALNQAVAYATFIRELLRSESSEYWFTIFGFKRDIPEKLKIRACVAMPNNAKGKNDTEFGNKEIPIGDTGDTIECHYIYFDWSDSGISNLTTSL